MQPIRKANWPAAAVSGWQDAVGYECIHVELSLNSFQSALSPRGKNSLCNAPRCPNRRYNAAGPMQKDWFHVFLVESACMSESRFSVDIVRASRECRIQ